MGRATIACDGGHSSCRAARATPAHGCSGLEPAIGARPTSRHTMATHARRVDAPLPDRTDGSPMTAQGWFDRASALARMEDETFDVLVVGGGITGAGARSTPRRGACAPRWSSGTTSRRARRRSRRSSCTAGSATCSSARSASSTRPSPNARCCARTRPHLVARPALPAAGVHRAAAVIARKLARLLGTRDVGVRPHRRAAHRQAAQARSSNESARAHADAARRRRRARRTSTTTRRPTTPASRSRSRGPRPRLRRACVANYAAVVGSMKDGDGSVAARVQADGDDEIDVRARARRERDRGVGRRRARARRGHAPRLDPAGQGHPHHGAVGEGAQRHRGRHPRAQGPALGVRRAVGRRGRRPPVHLHRHHRHRLRRPARRPAVHPRRRRRTCSRDQRHQSTTHDHRSRHPRHVGRAAAAGARRRRASAPPTSPAGTPCGRRRSGVVTVTGGKLTTYRRMAADAVDAVVQGARRRASAAAAPRTCRLLGGDGLGRAGGTPGEPVPTSTSPTAYGSDAPRSCWRSTASDPSSPSRSSPGLPYLRAEVVYAVRYEMARTRRRRALAPHPGAPAGARRVGRRRPRRRRAHGRRARLVDAERRPPGRRATGRWSTQSEQRPDFPDDPRSMRHRRSAG